MYSEKFLNFIKIWQDDFAIERSIDEKICVDKNGQPIPWYTYPAIEYLAQFDYSEKEIFEFGCGYSSLFWAERAKKVTSIENHDEWFCKWKREFKRDNLDIRLCHEGEDYYQSIQKDNKKYDVIVIDGKCRAQCAKEAVSALNQGGIVILDDSDRVNTSSEYTEAISILKQSNLIQIDFYGFCPMNNYTKATSLFLSRDFDFKSKYPVQPVSGIGSLWCMRRKQRKEYYKANR